MFWVAAVLVFFFPLQGHTSHYNQRYKNYRNSTIPVEARACLVPFHLSPDLTVSDFYFESWWFIIHLIFRLLEHLDEHALLQMPSSDHTFLNHSKQNFLSPFCDNACGNLGILLFEVGFLTQVTTKKYPFFFSSAVLPTIGNCTLQPAYCNQIPAHHFSICKTH